jgi:hypothetical protein
MRISSCNSMLSTAVHTKNSAQHANADAQPSSKLLIVQTTNISTSATLLPQTACSVPWRRADIIIVAPAARPVRSVAMNSLHAWSDAHLKVLVGAIVFDIETFATMLAVLCGLVLLPTLVYDYAGDDAEDQDKAVQAGVISCSMPDHGEVGENDGTYTIPMTKGMTVFCIVLVGMSATPPVGAESSSRLVREG